MASVALPLTPDGDVNKGPLILTVIWVEFSLAAAILGLRIWIRTRVIRFWGWDDVVMCLALLCSLLNTALMTASLNFGTGRHIVYLSDHEAMMANKFNWISQGFHVMGTNWGKVSIALFLLRLVDRAKKQRYYFYAGIVMLTLINAASIGSIYGQCEHSADLWRTPRKGVCWDPSVHQTVAYFQSSLAAFTDFVLAIYPVYVIWNLQMAMHLKVAVSFVMMLGIVAMAAAIAKTVYLSQLVARADYTFETAILCIWVATEQYLIIIAACIPTLAPLVKMAKMHTNRGSNVPNKLGYGYSGSNTTRASIHGRIQSYCHKITRPRSVTPHEIRRYTLPEYGPRVYPHIDMTLRQDDDSIKVIGNQQFYPAGRIMRTTEVEIESSREEPTSFYYEPPLYEQPIYEQDEEWGIRLDKEVGHIVNRL